MDDPKFIEAVSEIAIDSDTYDEVMEVDLTQPHVTHQFIVGPGLLAGDPCLHLGCKGTLRGAQGTDILRCDTCGAKWSLDGTELPPD